MATLHTINQAPAQDALWSKLLLLACEGDAVLLIEDACYLLLSELPPNLQSSAQDKDLSLYLLKEDAEARGLNLSTTNTSQCQIEIVDYKRFVELAASHDKTISWHQ